jgi:phage terminase small subunit
MPPPPKTRKRRPSGKAVVLPAEPPKRRQPRCPSGLGDDAREYWAAIWASPMSIQYQDADAYGIRRLVTIYDQIIGMQKDGNPRYATLAEELRQLEDRYGLSPMSRRRLEWRIENQPPDSEAEVHLLSDERYRHLIE